MKITIKHDTIKALLVIALKSDVRYYLNGVCVDVRNGMTTLVATDGHRLLAVPVLADDVEGVTNGQYIIPRAALEAVKPCKYGKNSLPITIEIAGTQVTITGATTATSPTTDGSFPDWRRVVPASANGIPAQFNPSYLGDWGKVAEYLGASGKGSGVTAVIHHNGDASALVTFPISDALGVVMPCRLGANGEAVTHPGLPAWARMSD